MTVAFLLLLFVDAALAFNLSSASLIRASNRAMLLSSSAAGNLSDPGMHFIINALSKIVSRGAGVVSAVLVLLLPRVCEDNAEDRP